jgi:2'-hydroxyisoflavone reductase
VGRSAVEAALERGDEITMFNRGRHNPDLFPDVRKLRGDRRKDLTSLEGTRWDIVIDTCAFQPEDVHGVAEVIGHGVERYVFVSSASVYRDWPAKRVSEESRVWLPGDGDNDYGIGKAQCEAAFEAAMTGRVVHARAGVIVGPYENIGRLPYWLERMAFDDILAPGARDRPLQLLDARDLATWMLDAASSGSAGVFNVAGEPGTYAMGDLIDRCSEATGSTPTIEWVEDGFLLEREVEPWAELPLWLPNDPENEHAFDVPIDRALTAGLVNRPLSETVTDTWDSMQSSDPGTLSAMLARPKEEQLLAEWRKRP